jgi:hypothetical protein
MPGAARGGARARARACHVQAILSRTSTQHALAETHRARAGSAFSSFWTSAPQREKGIFTGTI